MNHCDHGHGTREEVRLLPTSGGDYHGNMIVCHMHYLHELNYRRGMGARGSAEHNFNPFPEWNDLKIDEQGE